MVKFGWILLCWLVLNPGAMAADLGRLFTSNTERIRLDKARQTGIAEVNNAAQADAELLKEQVEKTPVEESVVDKGVIVNGWVKREDGPDLIWMNGALLNQAQQKKIGLVKPLDNAGRIMLQTNQRPVLLKAGQRVTASGDAVLENYQRDPEVKKGGENEMPAKP